MNRLFVYPNRPGARLITSNAAAGLRRYARDRGIDRVSAESQ
jgi:hypothetical protein